MTRMPASQRISGTIVVPVGGRASSTIRRFPAWCGLKPMWRLVSRSDRGSLMLSRSERFDVQHGDEHPREGLPGLRRRHGALLEGLEQHVLGPERELADLIDQKEPAVRLEELARLEHEGAHRVADLLELTQVDVAGQVVRKDLTAPLEPGEPEPFP